jgi:hypothetical protein
MAARHRRNTPLRLWTLHPKYLDPKGLVALWREALLAQAVLRGKTRGYTHHPQLLRFRQATSPAGAIAAYLRSVHAESFQRGYRFDKSKIGSAGFTGLILATRGQLDYEWGHLKNKLATRAPELLDGIHAVAQPDPHPLFRIEPGGIESWEVITPDGRSSRM